MSDLDKKVRQSVSLLESLRDNYDGVVELSYSGGKDSDIILELAKYAGLKCRAIYKRTTIDPPYTEKHVKSKEAEVVKPKQTFFELVRKKGFPTMRARFCCRELKEYKILDKAVQGIRRSESKKRMKRYTEPSFCRIYEGGEKTEIFLPILEWTNDDVYNFICANGIRCHPLYYDEKGRFDVNRRLGCMGCPLSIKNAIMDFHQYPQLLKLFLKKRADMAGYAPECGFS